MKEPNENRANEEKKERNDGIIRMKERNESTNKITRRTQGKKERKRGIVGKCFVSTLVTLLKRFCFC